MRNAIISLAAHTIIDDETAGSAPKKCSNMGTAAPEKVAMEKVIIIEATNSTSIEVL